MQRQRYGLNPATGRVEHHYVQIFGVRAKPLAGHDRPTAMLAVGQAGGFGNVALGHGSRQISLGRAA